MVQAPEVLTVLFTDVVGSTNLLTRLGDDAADTLRRSHFAVLRRAIADNRGREVKSLGDGLMVAFGSVRDAIACAAAMQQAVTAGPDALGLRVGIDAGEPIREGDDLFGTPVVVARRLCDRAAGGQVLVSDVVRLLAGRRLTYELDPLGPVELKGLDAAVVAHSVRWQATAPRIRLCGGLSIEQDGERLDERLPSRQARMLFALLALHHGQDMSRDALCDALWPAVAPRSRDSSLRALLTGARRVFGPGSIEGRERVRLVLPERATVDIEEAREQLERAEESLERSDFDAAARAASRAGALTAEELLAGLSAPWIDHERAEVEELSHRALEIEARASLSGGRPSDAERAARRLVERSPYRESAYALLMEALAAQGNVAEATLAFDRLRTLLREELGTTPAGGILALYERLIAGVGADGNGPDASPSRPPLPVAIARDAEHPFVARADERARIVAAWEAVQAGEGRVVVLAGEPGIGKTSLAAVFARDAHAGGAAVLLGRCHAEALVPYEPFVEALRQLAPAQLDQHAQQLGRVMPELASDSPAAAEREDPAARYLLFEAVARTLTDGAHDAPIVLVLEDLHWADAPTLLLLKHVARVAERARLLVLGTYRSTDVPGTERVVDALTDLSREVALERVAIGGLADDDVAQLIGELDGRRPSWVLGSAMRRDTAGNPLFVGQLLRHLADTHVLVERDGELAVTSGTGRLGVPDSAKELVARRLSGLPSETVSALRTAAVIGRTFKPELVAAVEHDDPDAVLDALEQAVAAGLVEEVSADQQSFVHALVREAIYERAGAGRRVRLHRRVAEELEARGADPAELAHHYLAAGDRGRGLEYSVATADRALGQFAYEDAALHYARALEALGDADLHRRCELLLALGDARARAGDEVAMKVAFRQAAELATSLGMAENLARAALGYGGRFLWDVSRGDDYLPAVLRRALDMLDERDSDLRVRLLSRLAGGPLRDASVPRAERHGLSTEALAMARRLDDPSTLAYAIDGYVISHHAPDHTHEQLRLAHELVELSLAIGDKERATEACEQVVDSLLELGDHAGAREMLESMAELASELRQPAQEWSVLAHRAILVLQEGRLAEAEGLIGEAHRRGEHAQSWTASTCYGLQMYVLRWHQRRLAEMDSLVRGAVREDPTYLIWRCVLAHVEAQLDHPDAHDTFDALAEDDFGILPFDEEWLVSVSLLADAARVQCDAERAAVLYEALRPYADRVSYSYPEVSLGSTARYVGILATTTARWAEAERHFETALEVNARIGAEAWLAATEHDYGLMLLAKGGSGEEADARLRRAADAYRNLGMDHRADEAAAVKAP
jgi:class 3 adenylate cyclase/DNA-binding SARP family transcriptional activator